MRLFYMNLLEINKYFNDSKNALIFFLHLNSFRKSNFNLVIDIVRGNSFIALFN